MCCIILPRQNVFKSHWFYVKFHIITLPAKKIKTLGVALQGVWSSKHSWNSIILWQLWLASGLFQMSLVCFCPPLSRKRGDIKSHLSVCPSVPLSVRLSVTKTLTLAITFALLQVEPWYLACVFFVTRPFRWYHVVTLTVTFDLLQGQICCPAGDHNSLNLLVFWTWWGWGHNPYSNSYV